MHVRFRKKYEWQNNHRVIDFIDYRIQRDSSPKNLVIKKKKVIIMTGLLALKLLQTCVNFFCWTQKIFQRISVTSRPIFDDSHSLNYPFKCVFYWPDGVANVLINNVSITGLFCIQMKSEWMGVSGDCLEERTVFLFSKYEYPQLE